MALYVHCFAHCVNLATEAMCTESVIVRNALGVCNEVGVLPAVGRGVTVGVQHWPASGVPAAGRGVTAWVQHRPDDPQLRGTAQAN